MKKEILIPKETLVELYWNQNLKPKQIALMFRIKNERTVRKKMEKYGIKRKTVSEALTRKFKRPFTGNLQEKAYFLGLRAGDFHAKRIKRCIRIQTSTTHTEQVRLLEKAFQNYGQLCVYLSKDYRREDEWFIYVDLHPSFKFLLEKSKAVPKWILENENLFFSFLAAYMDCEGNWHLSRSHDTYARFTFRLRSGDLEILKDIKEKLESYRYKTVFSLDIKKGTVNSLSKPFRTDIYNLTINGKDQVIRLIEKLLPFTKHAEKIWKMEFMLNYKMSKYLELIDDWNEIKRRINKGLLAHSINKGAKTNVIVDKSLIST